MRAHPLLDLPADLPQQLGRQQDDRRRAVADLGVLRPRNVHQRPRRRVDDVEQLEDGRAVVGDGRVAAVVDDQLVHPARAERRRHRLGDGRAR